jgi:hypothetical protein
VGRKPDLEEYAACIRVFLKIDDPLATAEVTLDVLIKPLDPA